MENFNLTYAILLGITTLQGVLLIINFAFMKKGSRLATFFLMATTIAVTLILFQNFLIFSGSYYDFPHLIFLFTPLSGLIGSCFYLYVVFLLHPDRKFKLYDFLHLGLFFLILYNHWGFLTLAGEYKIKTATYFYYEEHSIAPSYNYRLIFYRLVILAYGFASLYLIKEKIKELKRWNSSTNIQYLNKFKLITYLFIGYAALYIIGYFYTHTFHIAAWRYETYLQIINSLIILVLAVIVMQQPERLIFLLKWKPPTEKPIHTHKLSIESVREFMAETKPFLDPDLKLHDLAKQMNTPPYVLSDIINQEEKINFYQFINQYRVEEFMQRVSLPEFNNYTLLAIAFDVGFNSKASFNRIFKQHTQMTPSEYKRKKVGLIAQS